MKYIGNKSRLLNFIKESMLDYGINFKKVKVIDLFSGTGTVTNFFLQEKCEVISCDNMTYSIAEQYRINYFQTEPKFPELKSYIKSCKLDDVLDFLNNLNPLKGYFYENYAPSGKAGRKYFSDSNAEIIDAIREQIKKWELCLPYEKSMFLNGILMCAADKVSNTSGTYGAFLKIWRSMALKPLLLEKPKFSSSGKNIILKDDVINCVSNYKHNDIVYLDPPYNKRQYASNFHVLESLVVYDKQFLKGVTGLRNYENQKSKFCQTREVKNEFTILIEKINSKYIVMSYSNEGLLSKDDIISILAKKGDFKIYGNPYRRFKTNSWTNEETGLEELLFICKTFDYIE